MTKANSSECHVHDEVDDSIRDKVRESVCVPENEFPLVDYLGKKYCLFHLPTEDKYRGEGIGRFRDILYERVDAVEKKVEGIDAMSKEDQANLRAENSHDFRYVWFPSRVYMSGRILNAPVSFRGATFSRIALFKGTTFWDADFRSATFLARADFEKATFKAEAFFGGANFLADARFVEAKFKGNRETFFNETTFENTTVFDDAEFYNDVSFNSANLGKDSDVFFLRSRFAGNIDFQYCIAQGYLRFNDLQGDEYRLDFQDAAFERAARISFHTMPLYPRWFVNIDTRKFVFTEIKWLNDPDKPYWGKKHIDSELVNLEKRDEREQNKRLYELVIRELEGRADWHKSFVVYDERSALLYLESNVNIRVKAGPVENRISLGKYGHLCEIDVYKILANAATRRYDFKKVEWQFLLSYLNDKNPVVENRSDELKRLNEFENEPTSKAPEQKRHLLEVSCRQLAVNAEEDNRYRQASKFRYMAMETHLREKVSRRKYPFLTLLYKWSSRYGESWLHAFCLLIGILVLLGALYAAPYAHFDYGETGHKPGDGVVSRFCDRYLWFRGNHYSSGMNLCEGAVHSLSVASFQRPEPKASNFVTRAFVTLETIFAPLQAALLALAIRRKFMR